MELTLMKNFIERPLESIFHRSPSINGKFDVDSSTDEANKNGANVIAFLFFFRIIFGRGNKTTLSFFLAF